MSLPSHVLDRMHTHVDLWRSAADDRALFLDCYRRMSENVLDAISCDEFADCAWVERLLHRFADYYFVALEAFEADPTAAPAVWRHAHLITRAPDVSPVQKLLVGVSAHINYDLVLTLDDLLRPEWTALTEAARRARYDDHCRINAVIGRTIDTVQDEVLGPAMPVMALLDHVLGPVDEMLASLLISRWRESVWANTARLLVVDTPDERAREVRRIEAEALQTARLMCFGGAQSSTI